MKMLMLVSRSSLKERIYDMLDKCAIRAFSEVTDTVGCGVTGSAERSVFNPSTNSILLVAGGRRWIPPERWKRDECDCDISFW
jgi:hypothetical protein